MAESGRAYYVIGALYPIATDRINNPTNEQPTQPTPPTAPNWWQVVTRTAPNIGNKCQANTAKELTENADQDRITS